MVIMIIIGYFNFNIVNVSVIVHANANNYPSNCHFPYFSSSINFILNATTIVITKNLHNSFFIDSNCLFNYLEFIPLYSTNNNYLSFNCYHDVVKLF